MATRLLSNTIYRSLGIQLEYDTQNWTYETINGAHISLSNRGKAYLLDLNKILGIHLFLASLLCFGFGSAHLSGFLGPGMWTSDSFGLVGWTSGLDSICETSLFSDWLPSILLWRNLCSSHRNGLLWYYNFFVAYF